MDFQNLKSNINSLSVDIKCIYCNIPAIKKQLKLLSCLHVICNTCVKVNSIKTENNNFTSSGKMKYMVSIK